MVVVLVVACALLFTKVTTAGRQRTLVRNALEHVWQAQNYHTKVSLSFTWPTLPGTSRPITDIVLRTEGDVAPTVEGAMSFAGTLHGEARGPGTILFTDGEIVILPQAVTFRLSTLPSLLRSSGTLVNKWTQVKASVLAVSNASVLAESLSTIFERVEYDGKDTIPGQDASARHYHVVPTPEEEERLLALTSSSASPSWEIVARLLHGFEVGQIDLWIDSSSEEVRFVDVTFIENRATQEAEERAHLALSFSDFGKMVTIEQPSPALTVRPEVFRRIFQGPLDLSTP